MKEVATTNQTANTVNQGDLVGGNKTINNTVNHHTRQTKLSSLFEKLKVEFANRKTIESFSDDFLRYSLPRDTIGLEQKLHDGGRAHMIEDASWLKQEYFKKLTRFQFYEPAQEIHSFLLSLVLHKFKYVIYPLLNSGGTEKEISDAISQKIIDPIVQTILEEGCNDIMGLSATDIDGMIYFLTGQCHIKWIKNDNLPPSI